MFTILVIGRSQFFKKYFEAPKIEVGRAIENDLVLPDLSVSRRHCRILVHRLEFRLDFWVEDLGSANGCYLNGKPAHSPSIVPPQVELRIGTYALYLQSGKASLGSYLGPSVEAARRRTKTRLSAQRSNRSPTAHTGPLPHGGAWEPEGIPTRASLRRMINRVLCGDPELDAFCLDHFPTIRARFASHMEQTTKVSKLLEYAPLEEVLRCLYEDYPEEVERNQRLLCYEDD